MDAAALLRVLYPDTTHGTLALAYRANMIGAASRRLTRAAPRLALHVAARQDATPTGGISLAGDIVYPLGNVRQNSGVPLHRLS